MGLLTTIRQQKREDKEVRVLILGLDGAGKTSVVNKFQKRGKSSEIAPTIGFEISTIQYKDLSLNIWDIGGQKTLRPFWYNYLDRTDCVIWVIDCGALERLQESFNEFTKLLSEDRMAGAGLLILANKCDCIADDHMSTVLQLISSTLRLESITNRQCGVIACSAITGVGIEDALQWIVDEVRQRLYVL